MSTGAAPAPHLLLPQHAPHFQNAHASYEAPPPPAPWPRPQAPGQFLTEAGLRAPYPQGPPPQGPWGVVHGHSSFQMDSIARQDQSYARAAGTEWYPKPNVARPVLAAEHHQPGYQLPPINTFDLPTTQSNSSGSTGALPALDVWPTQHPPKDPLAPSLSAPLPIRAASAYVRELNPISQSLPSLPLKRAGIPTERDAASGSTSSLAKRPRIVDSFESQVSGRIQNTSVSNIIPHLDGPAAGWHRHGNVAEPRQPAQPDTRPPAPNSPINPSTEPNPQSWREWYSKYNNGAFVHRQNLATPPASTGRSTPGSDGRVEADHAAAARRQPSAPSPTSNHSMSPPRIEEPMPDSVSRAKGIKPDQLPDFVYQASQEVMKEAQMPDSFGLGFNGSRGKERGAKKKEEKARRDAFKHHLSLLVSSIPGLSSYADTRKAIIVYAREYLAQLQNREKSLRAVLMERVRREEAWKRAMEKRGIDVDAIESELESDSETRDIEGLQRRVEELLEAMESGAKGGEEEAVRALAGLSGYKGSS